MPATLLGVGVACMPAVCYKRVNALPPLRCPAMHPQVQHRVLMRRLEAAACTRSTAELQQITADIIESCVGSQHTYVHAMALLGMVALKPNGGLYRWMAQEVEAAAAARHGAERVYQMQVRLLLLLLLLPRGICRRCCMRMLMPVWRSLPSCAPLETRHTATAMLCHAVPCHAMPCHAPLCICLRQPTAATLAL